MEYENLELKELYEADIAERTRPLNSSENAANELSKNDRGRREKVREIIKKRGLIEVIMYKGYFHLTSS